MLVRYRGIDNKGVLDRPWTIWGVLRAISSTLKFQFTIKPESQRFDYLVRQNIGDPGSRKLRKVFALMSVLPKPPQLPYGANTNRGGRYEFELEFEFPEPANRLVTLYVWALASEPGLLDFQVLRSVIIENFVLRNMFGKNVGAISRNI